MAISWTITADSTLGTVKFLTSGVVPIDLSLLIEGDYVNISGPQFSVFNRGSFRVKEVSTYYVLTTLYQYFVVENSNGVSESVSQTANSDITYFRPFRASTQTSEARTVSVANTEPGVIDISLPALSNAVSRDFLTAFYPADGETFEVERMVQYPNGYIRVVTSSPHGLSIGDMVEIQGFKPSKAFPWTSLNPTTNLVSPSHVSHWWVVSQRTGGGIGYGGASGAALGLTSSRAIFMGGHSMDTSVEGDTDNCQIFTLGSIATDTSSRETQGAEIIEYSWDSVSLSQARSNLSASELPDNNVLAIGGVSSPFAISDAWDIVDPATATLVDSGTNAAAKRAGHAQYSIQSGVNAGRVIVMGGAIDRGNATAGTSLFNSDGSIFGSGASMPYAACDFGSCQLSDGRIFISGGRHLGQTYSESDSLVAEWLLDTGSSPEPDTTGNYDLTGVSAPTVVTGTKINDGYSLSGGSYFEASTSAAAELSGDWSVEFWVRGWTAGVVVSHGGATGASADNKLLEIELLADNIRVRWEYGSGTEEVVTSGVLSAYPALKLSGTLWNHVVVTRIDDGAGNYNVYYYLNGQLINISSVGNPADGGGSGVFYLGHDPKGLYTDFDGVIDSARVLGRALSQREIVESYVRTGGQYSSEWDELCVIGECSNKAAIYSPVTNTWTQLPPMIFARAWHSLIPLDDGRVVAIGGMGYIPSQFQWHEASFASNWTNTIAQHLSACEIYDPASNRWSSIDSMSIPRRSPAAAKMALHNKILVASGYTVDPEFDYRQYPFDQISVPQNSISETLDLNSLKWSVTPHKVSSGFPNGSIVSLRNDDYDLAVMNGLYDASASTETEAAWMYHQKNDIITKRLNGTYKIKTLTNPFVGGTSANELWLTDGEPLPGFNYGYSSNIGGPVPSMAGIDGFGDDLHHWHITQIQRASNVITVTLDVTGNANKARIAVGDVVMLNSLYSSYTNSGLKTVTGVSYPSATTASITYSESGSDFDSTLSADGRWGSIATQNSRPSMFALAATDSGVNGPYIFDVQSGLPVTGTFSRVVTPILAGSQVASIDLGFYGSEEALKFPDEQGYLVFGFGTKDQVGPVKYLGRISETSLSVDYSFVWPTTIDGLDVILLNGRAPFNPEADGSFSGAYLTNSAVGRVAAQNFIEDATAAGFQKNIEIKYPSDIGLGGQGSPTTGSKISDKVRVFGGDDLDIEIAKAEDI